MFVFFGAYYGPEWALWAFIPGPKPSGLSWVGLWALGFGLWALWANRGTAHHHLPGVGGPHPITNFQRITYFQIKYPLYGNFIQKVHKHDIV
ncbi:hypothetical protein ACN38_g12387, partial [Penicillium nordicum]